MKTALLVTLGIFTAGFVFLWLLAIFANRRDDRLAEGAPPKWMPGPLDAAIGFVTDFFDTLSLGSVAPTTALFKVFGVVADELIPGTLNVRDARPSIRQACVYIDVVT